MIERRRTYAENLHSCCPGVPVGPSPFAQETPQFTAETDHYRIFTETTQAQADDIAKRMEAALALYNSVFHFDLTVLPAKFRVRLFKDLDSFNAYLNKVLSQTRTDFVFVAWSDPERSELLCFPKDDKAFTASLLHQGCIQFIKGFIDNPPVWLREGVATYLDASTWDPATGTFSLKPNLAWLDGLKAIVRGDGAAKLIELSDLLTLSREKAQTQMEVFAPQSWGLVQFLLNAPDRTTAGSCGIRSRRSIRGQPWTTTRSAPRSALSPGSRMTSCSRISKATSCPSRRRRTS